MRLDRVTNPETVLTSFDAVSKKMTESGTPRTISIGYTSGSETVTAYWNKEHNFWSRLEPENTANPDMIMCTCGAGEPLDGKDNPITVEINIDKKGTSWNLGGVFVTETRTKTILLSHTGKISGQRGANRESFLDSIPAYMRPTVKGKGAPREIIVIGDISSDDFLENLGSFVNRVAKFKTDLKNSK
jgi:hypothetical protein